MTKFCVEGTVVERLKEEDLNIDSLLREYSKKYVEENYEKVKEYRDDYLKDNKEKIQKRMKEYNSHPKVRTRIRKYYNEKLKNDKQFYVKEIIRRR